jgi:guanyl-specific ribonuclease Sa
LKIVLVGFVGGATLRFMRVTTLSLFAVLLAACEAHPVSRISASTAATTQHASSVAATPVTPMTSSNPPSDPQAADDIDGKSVTAEQFAAFEKSLTNRQDRIVCAETTTGGYSTYAATAPNGVRYEIQNESVNGRSRGSARRVSADNP